MTCRLGDNRCRQLIGQFEKIKLAANNGDTLGEAVIFVKRNEFRSGQQRKIRLKKQPENRTNIIIYYLFQ
jgi:hypothetical protein